ncbi:MAG: adenosine deaminase [Micrococcales bacterium]
MSKFNIRELPKISLHDHLDGGLRPQTVIELASDIGYNLPEHEAKALREWFFKASDSGSLVEYLTTFDHTTAVMQTAAALKRVAYEFAMDLANDGIIYGEVRWAPEQHLRAGLSLDEAVTAVQDGLEEAMANVESQGGFLRTGQLVTAMRHADRGLEIAELAVRHRNEGVVGFDIAGAEKGFLPVRHKVAFDYLASELFPVTIHAGEADGIESIKDALVNGRALRLGHGVRIAEDILFVESDGGSDFVQLGPVARWVYDRDIALELCPSSNLQTDALKFEGVEYEGKPTIEDHPFDALYDIGFKVTVNTDNRLQSQTSLTRELELLTEAFDYSLGDLEQFQLNAADASFLDLEEREELVDLISEGFKQARK